MLIPGNYWNSYWPQFLVILKLVVVTRICWKERKWKVFIGIVFVNQSEVCLENLNFCNYKNKIFHHWREWNVQQFCFNTVPTLTQTSWTLLCIFITEAVLVLLLSSSTSLTLFLWYRTICLLCNSIVCSKGRILSFHIHAQTTIYNQIITGTW